MAISKEYRESVKAKVEWANEVLSEPEIWYEADAWEELWPLGNLCGCPNTMDIDHLAGLGVDVERLGGVFQRNTRMEHGLLLWVARGRSGG